jgi:hypothetical protein
MAMPKRNTAVLLAALGLACVSLLPLAGQSQTGVLTVTLELPDTGAPDDPTPAAVLVVSQGLEEPLRAEVEMPGSVSFSLPANAAVQVEVEAPGLWAPTQAVWLGKEPEAVTVRLRPTGVLEGTVTAPAGVRPPETIETRFRSAPGAEEPLEGEHSQPCSVEQEKLRCELPAGALDLRLGARGFVSVYLWGLEVAPGRTHPLGSLLFRPGASVIGWVTAAGEGFEPDSAKVSLAPQSAGTVLRSDTLERQASLELTTKANSRGFFSLGGVAPGSYRLTVEHPGFAPARLSPVVVRDGVEVELPLVELAPPLRLEVGVQPLRDPFHNPWLLELLQEAAMPGVLEPVADGSLDEAGIFHAGGLEPGVYRLRVTDSRGSHWHAETLELTADSRHEVVLPFQRLEGLLTLAGEPLPGATVFFGGRSGEERVVVGSNEEGKLYVFLPRRESWLADIEKESIHLRTRVEGIRVDKEPGEPWAKVEIEVPDTRVFGEVVDEAGRPLPRAMVEVKGPGEGESHQVFAGEDGTFEVRGFGEGRWRLEARHRTDAKSPTFWAPVTGVEVEEGSPTGPVRLVARKGWEISGLVVAPNGNGVPGATVAAVLEHPAGTPSLEIPYQVTGVDGAFQIRVPGEVAAVQLQVFPPGFAVRQMRVGLPRDEPVFVPVDPAGGTLVLVAGASGRPLPADFTLRTAVFGEFLHVTPLLRIWAGVHGLRDKPDRLVVPQLEPGVYTACWDAVQAALPSGRLPVGWPGLEDRCVSGTVVPSGEVVLEVPVPASGPPGSPGS